MGKTTEDESAVPIVWTGRRKVNGKEEFLARRQHREQGVAALRRSFRKAIMTELNFEIKVCFTSKLGGMCGHQILTRVRIEC